MFEGTRGISLENARTRFTGNPMEIALSHEMLGRVFDGAGRPIDGLGEILPRRAAQHQRLRHQPGLPPVSPEAVSTPASPPSTALATLIRGQKLPIFSGSGMKHNELAAQIVRQAKVAGDDGRDSPSSLPPWASRTTWPSYFRRSFEEAGVLQRVVMFLNLSNDPIIERILTPRCALTAAEYLAFEHGLCTCWSS